MFAMEVTGCYVKSQCLQCKSLVAMEIYSLIWKVNGCYGSQWVSWKASKYYGNLNGSYGNQ
jgi:hypothetical protein